MYEEGDKVVPIGRLKKVVDFLSSSDKETIRILASFFQGDAKGTVDARRLKKACRIKKVYPKHLEVELQKNYVWEEKQEYFTYENSKTNANTP